MNLVPQYSMMSTTLTSLVFGLVFLFLAKQSNRKYMALWGFCWLLYAIMFFLDFASFTGIHISQTYITERQIIALIASFLFLLGSYDFFRIKVPQFLYFSSVLFLLLILMSSMYAKLFWIFAIPCTMYSSLLLVLAGCMFISFSWTQNLPEKILASFLIILWSIFLNNFGFSSNAESVGLYNYFVGILVVNLLTIILMIIHFKKLTFLIEKHERSLKMAEISRKDLIDNISHEVRTPITLIQGYTESMLNGIIPPNATDTYLKMIRSKAILITTLLEDLIQASHLSSQTLDFKFYEENTFDFILDIFDHSEFQISASGHTFRGENWVDKHVVSIIDTSRLQQVITNLINNSIRHTPEGKEIAILCYSLPTSPDALAQDFSMTIPDGNVFVSVIDEGDGISSEDFSHIFERTFSGKNTGGKKSSGLGLFISNEIIKQHSGTMWAENMESGGAKLAFSIPYYLLPEESL